MASQYQVHAAPRRDLEESAQDYPYPPNSTSYDSNDPYALHTKPAEEARVLARTPSPTPSEARELKTGVFDWKTLGKWKFWIRREWLCSSLIPSIIDLFPTNWRWGCCAQGTMLP